MDLYKKHIESIINHPNINFAHLSSNLNLDISIVVKYIDKTLELARYQL